MAAFVVLLAGSPALAHQGCNTSNCRARVEKRQQVEAQGVNWCHATWRCAHRARARHPELGWRLAVAPLRGILAAIASCESGGNPRAISPSGAYRGRYQFDLTTWQTVGGRGDPAAAPAREQDYRAALLYQRRGARPWPVCGRH